MNKQSIIHKIKSLFAKAEDSGATEAEASLAMDKANELMKKYMIQRGDLSDPEKYTSEDRFYKNHAYEVYYLMLAPEKMFAVESSYSYHKIKGEKKIKITFFGEEEKVSASFSMYESLVSILLTNMAKYKKSKKYKDNPSHGRTKMANFVKGFCYRVVQRAKELNSDLKDEVRETTGRELVVLEEEQVRKAFKNKYNVKSRTSRISNYDPKSFNQGKKVGNTVDLNQKVGAV